MTPSTAPTQPANGETSSSYNYEAAQPGEATVPIAGYIAPGALMPPPVNLQLEEELVAQAIRTVAAEYQNSLDLALASETWRFPAAAYPLGIYPPGPMYDSAGPPASAFGTKSHYYQRYRDEYHGPSTWHQVVCALTPLVKIMVEQTTVGPAMLEEREARC